LIKLCEYEEARKVRSMIEKILPEEEENFRREFDGRIEQRREHLRKCQSDDVVRLEEKIKALEWNNVRARNNAIIT
jgi:hypothetical protein